MCFGRARWAFTWKRAHNSLAKIAKWRANKCGGCLQVSSLDLRRSSWRLSVEELSLQLALEAAFFSRVNLRCGFTEERRSAPIQASEQKLTRRPKLAKREKKREARLGRRNQTSLRLKAARVFRCKRRRR